MTISDVMISSEERALFLKCDDIYAQEQRNRELAAALETDEPNILVSLTV